MSPKPKVFQTFPSRWGVGKTHRLVWSHINRVWYLACKEPGAWMHGREVDSSTAITCKNCKRWMAQ